MRLGRRLGVSILLALGIACSEQAKPEDSAQLILRRSGASILVELQGVAEAPRALQAELLVDGTSAQEFLAVAPPAGLPLDTVRLQDAGTNRAILFVADKRGIKLPTAGPVAVLEVVGQGDAKMRIGSAVISSLDGALVPVRLGPSITLR